MTKVPLRAYNREIEEAIDQKQIEEAIAHCIHILKSFPKHVATYRLLGKAYLESQRYGNAADIFQRVLSSIPDDFISHVGMSIIREDEGNLDAAIWHMERAFESQSYNTAIQGELRRLYGLRDGMEPPKIRMTRGALARMYAKSDLFDQAIAEIRSNLAVDSQRTDLKVLLGKMYAKNGQHAEAIEVCSSLLQRLPFCLEANQLLCVLLPKSEHQEGKEIYQQRIQALDPYEAYVSPHSPTAMDVPDQAVTIARLDWDGGPVVPETTAQPEWATTIGVTLDESDALDESEELPDWLTDSANDYQELEGELDEVGDDELIPDWMQDAGWERTSGVFDESVPSFVLDEEESESLMGLDEAEAGEIPEWLQEIAPKETPVLQVEKIDEISPEGLTEDLPDWLSEEADGATDTIITWLDEKEKSEGILAGSEPEGDEIPDWRQGVVDKSTEPEAIQPTPSDEIAEVVGEVELPDADLPDELLDTTVVSEPSVIPDWLQSLGGEVPTETERSGVTDWLKNLEDEISEQEILTEHAAEVPLDETVLSDPESHIQAVAPLDEPTGESDLDEEIPDWLQKLKRDSSEQETEPEPSEILPSDDFSEETYEDEEIPAWLQSLKEESQVLDSEQESLGTYPSDDVIEEIPESVSGEIPEWLRTFEDAQPESETSIVPPVDELVEEMVETEPDDILDWLGELGDETGEPKTEPEPLVVLPSDEIADEGVEIEPGEIPDWLKGLEEEALELEAEPGTFSTVPSDELAEEADEPEPGKFLDWLAVLGDEKQVTEFETEPTMFGPSEERIEETSDSEPVDIPDWLQGLEDEAVEQESEPEPWSSSLLDGISEEAVEAEPGEIPDWLGTLGDKTQFVEFETEPTVIVPSEDRIEETFESEPGDIPEWLQGLGEETLEPDIVPELISALPGEETTEEAVVTEPGEIPDWLYGFEGETKISEMDTQPTVIIPPDEVTADTVETEPDITVEYVKDEIPETPAGIEPPDFPEWLLGLVDEETVPSTPDELPDISEAEPAEIPEWLGGLVDEIPESHEPEIPEVVPSDEILESWIEAEDSSIGDTELVHEIQDWLAEPDRAEEPYDFKEGEDSEVSTEYPEWLTDQVKQDEIESERLETAGTSAIETGEPLEDKSLPEIDFEDADAAMAWLDALALEGGITDDALLTRSEELSEEIADAVSGEPERIKEDDVDQVMEFAESVEFEPTSDLVIPQIEISDEMKSETTKDFEFEGADDAMAWLEGLAAKQGVSEDELITRPEERSDTPPTWVQQEIIEETQDELVEPPDWSETPEVTEPVVDIPDWLQDAIESEELQAAVSPDVEPETQPDTEDLKISADLPEFLREALASDTDYSTFLADEEPVSLDKFQEDTTGLETIAPGESEPQPSYQEIPEWLQETILTEAIEKTEEIESLDLPKEDKVPLDESYQWLPVDVTEEEIDSKQRLELNEASLNQLERLPSLGFQGAQAIVAYRNEHGPFDQLDDLLEVPGIARATIEAIRSEVMVTPPSVPETKVSTGVLDLVSKAEPIDKFHAIQLEAGSDLAEGNSDVAIKKYSGLIKKGKRLNEVIEDINKVLSSDIPNELCVEVLQILGDAYLKANRLQEALDSYTKAEELLR